MKMSQYVYFALRSETVPASEVTRRLGVEPDDARVRGETREGPPPVPEHHSWALYSADRGLRLDEHVERLVGRLTPYRDRIAGLVGDGEVSAALVIVRHFDDVEGEELPEPDFPASTGQGLSAWFVERHPLLGWRLTSEHLRFLASVSADVVAEEHG